MKPRLIPFFAAMSLMAIASCRDSLTGPTNSTIASDTVAYWTFNGNANDASGNGHDGTLTGKISYQNDRFGNAGKSIEIFGSAQMNVQSMPNFSENDSYTVTAWINISAGGSLLSNYGFGADSSGFGAVLGGCGQIISNAPLETDKWHLITLAVAAHSSATLYIDSVQVATKAYGDYTGTNDSLPFNMVFNSKYPSSNDTVRMDDAIFLNYCMSASKVSARFHEGGWYEGYNSPSSSSWTQGNFGTSQAIYDICFPNPKIGYACGASGTVLKSVDSGMTWTAQSVPTAGSEDFYGISFTNSLVGIVGGTNGSVFYTRDGGITWSSSSIFTKAITPFATIRDIKFIGVNALAVGGTDISQPSQQQGFEMLSADSGATWTGGSTDPDWLYSISRVSGQNLSLDTNLGYTVGAQGQIYWTDYGEEWASEGYKLGTTADFLGVDFAGDHGFAVGTSGTIYSGIYSDATVSSSWTLLNSGVSTVLHSIHTKDDNEAWAAGDNGVILHTLNDGQTWARADIAGISVRWNKIAARDANHLVFVGDNGTLYWRAP